MIYLILDTNIWIYLANGFDSKRENSFEGLFNKRHFSLLQILKNKTENNDFKIIVNHVIKDEWIRNKKRAKELLQYLKKQKTEIKEAENSIKKFLSKEDQPSLKVNIKNATFNITRLIEQNEKHIIDVEEFLNNKCLIIPVSDTVKIHASNLALKKNKAPFHNKENSIADAIILFSAIEYLKSELFITERRAIFVSNNYTDFAALENKEEFHQDIKDYIKDLDLTYQRHLSNAVELGNEMQEEIEIYLKYYRDKQEKIFYCQHTECIIDDQIAPYGYLNHSLRLSNGQFEEIEKSQLRLFDLTPLEISNNSLIPKTFCGQCFFCKTLHISCPKCYFVMAAWDEMHDFHCPNCQKSYEIIKSERNDDSFLKQK